MLHIEKVDSPEIVGFFTRGDSRGAARDWLVRRCSPRDRTSWKPISSMRKAFFAPIRLRSRGISCRDRAGAAAGYSIDDGESSPGVRCLAVAIRGAGGSPLFAISLTGPSGRFTAERLASCVPEMLAVARDLSTRFGGEASQRPEAVA